MSWDDPGEVDRAKSWTLWRSLLFFIMCFHFPSFWERGGPCLPEAKHRHMTGSVRTCEQNNFCPCWVAGTLWDPLCNLPHSFLHTVEAGDVIETRGSSCLGPWLSMLSTTLTWDGVKREWIITPGCFMTWKFQRLFLTEACPDWYRGSCWEPC